MGYRGCVGGPTQSYGNPNTPLPLVSIFNRGSPFMYNMYIMPMLYNINAMCAHGCIHSVAQSLGHVVAACVVGRGDCASSARGKEGSGAAVLSYVLSNLLSLPVSRAFCAI